MTEIRDLINQKIQAYNYSINRLALETGINYKNLWRFLNSKGDMTSRNIDKINSVLKIY